uniref:Uncharacterized protein n=1 Tax=Setaria digitata TaxID=48799 RepID=A0A915Q076_9BILA
MDKKRKEPCEDTTESPDQGTSRSVTGRSSLHTPGSSESKRKRVTFESDVLKADLETKYLFLFPEEFFVFWKHVQMLAGRDGNPCGKFLNPETSMEYCCLLWLPFRQIG